MTRGIELNNLLQPDRLAAQISNIFVEWETYRQEWIAQKSEIREYIFAVDTMGTNNSELPWKNKTHIPKLCQIRDNLQANYMAALFPTDSPIDWEGDDESGESKEKRLTIKSYLDNKMRMGGFKTEVAKCVNDYIDFGNCFAMPLFVAENTVDPSTGENIPGFVGPQLTRVSPLDIVFNPNATSFKDSAKIIHSLHTLSSLKRDIEEKPEMMYLADVFDKVTATRKQMSGMSMGDFSKSSSFQIDGFSSFLNYFQGDYVEVLDYYGDIYDQETGEFLKNQLISIVDRSWVIRKISNPSWLGSDGIQHAGWRLRQDNLYAMGPLDNLVGMQYRIDHLENAKADGFDLIVYPIQKIKGLVEDYEYQPGERIFCGDEGDVEFMSPDVTMLNADTQIAMYEAKMEEMAGAPKQAMGFRTPGEKTAYEVQILENGANRIFQNKAAYFEEAFLEPLLNNMLEIGRRNMGPTDVVRVVDDQYGAVSFMTITKEDITARGKIRPIGARHFARNANIVQNLTQLYASQLGQDPSVQAHISGKAVAKLIEEMLGLEKYKLVQDNIRVAEQFETQQLIAAGQQQLAEQQAPQGPVPPNGQQQPTDSVVPGPPQG